VAPDHSASIAAPQALILSAQLVNFYLRRGVLCAAAEPDAPT
jgi:hypothetical protein